MVTPPTIEVANLGMADSLILMVLALVVFGPRRLPQIGRQIGKLMYEFRKASNDFKFQMEEELRTAEEADRRKREEAERQKALAQAAPVQTAPAEPEASRTLEAGLEPASPAAPDATAPASEPVSPQETVPAAEPAPDPNPYRSSDRAAQSPPADPGVPRIQPPSTG
ncbi:MAG: twin-arginine translocase TatA/TatE family subunit, partial [Terracidiphilus sp.]